MVFYRKSGGCNNNKNAAEEKLADYEIVYAQGCPILSEDVKLEGFANYTEEKFSQEDCEK